MTPEQELRLKKVMDAILREMAARELGRNTEAAGIRREIEIEREIEELRGQS